jgi:beta-1,4-mannosyl-glycoprotein beta-1,4-N-acetylglucosaminyltransferase
MKIFDCTTYHNEDLILDARLNILDKFVDKFVICEALYTHAGKKKKLNFDIKKFDNFKKKIIYLVQENEPSDLIEIDDNLPIENQYSAIRSNSIKRISLQRNKLKDGLHEAEKNDFIFYSDNDEIPDFSQLNLNNVDAKLLIFEQKLFYFKFNLLLDRIYWYGTRGLRKKDLSSFQDLREIKPKKYPFYRIDTYFKKNKFIDLKIIHNGGWHFTRIISPEEIHERELNTEHSDEYIQSGKNVERIKDLIKRRVIDHDHLADKKDNKFGKEFKLKLFPVKLLPLYIQENMAKYKLYLDLN